VRDGFLGLGDEKSGIPGAPELKWRKFPARRVTDLHFLPIGADPRHRGIPRMQVMLNLPRSAAGASIGSFCMGLAALGIRRTWSGRPRLRGRDAERAVAATAGHPVRSGDVAPSADRRAARAPKFPPFRLAFDGQ
jgi:hypothetical protein